MGDEFLVVESEARARAITAQRQKQQELEQLEKQVKLVFVWHTKIGLDFIH